MGISKIRKQVIDDLVDNLCQNYNVRSYNGLKKIAEDNKIRIIKSCKVIFPATIHRESSDKKYILLRKHLFPNFGKEMFAHELGHLMLSHSKESMGEDVCEQEADYFQEKIGYSTSSKPVYAFESLVMRVINPIRSAKFVYLSDSGREQYYNNLIAAYNNRKLRE